MWLSCIHFGEPDGIVHRPRLKPAFPLIGSGFYGWD